ncbi:MAG: class I SAM-dependent methyltransferase [Thermocrispum sp.]
MQHDVPRGGPDARWWDRWYTTDKPEYIDQPEEVEKTRQVLRGLDRFQRVTRSYRLHSRLVAAEAAGLATPRILELGAGRGRLAQQILKDLPAAHVTVSDVNADALESFANGPLSADQRACARVIDATDIDAEDLSWDVAVFTTSLHHLEPPQVRKVFLEGTRVARRLLVVDLWRHPAMMSLVPVMVFIGGIAATHDGVISLRKAYSTSALQALAGGCGAAVDLHTRFHPPSHLVASAARAVTV